ADWAAHAGAAQPAVAAGHLVEVLLVVVLGVVEGRRVADLGGDLAVALGPQPLLIAVPRGLGRGALGVGVGVDRGAVLGPHVVALPHSLGRVVALPEGPQQVLVAHL